MLTHKATQRSIVLLLHIKLQSQNNIFIQQHKLEVQISKKILA